MQLRKYICFMMPGSFVAEMREHDITYSEAPEAPKHCFAYYFFSRYVTQDPQGNVINGPAFNETPVTYRGKEYTLEELTTLNDPKHKILISNIKCNGWARVVHTVAGNWLPLKDGDTVVS